MSSLYTMALAATLAAGGVEGDAEEIKWLALNVYHEARGENTESQISVAYVTINRMNDSKFPDTIVGVVQHTRRPGQLYKCQFTWHCDGKDDTPKEPVAWDAALKVATDAFYLKVKDPVKGATHYHTIDAKPVWRHNLTQVAVNDHHVFYRGF